MFLLKFIWAEEVYRSKLKHAGHMPFTRSCGLLTVGDSDSKVDGPVPSGAQNEETGSPGRKPIHITELSLWLKEPRIPEDLGYLGLVQWWLGALFLIDQMSWECFRGMLKDLLAESRLRGWSRAMDVFLLNGSSVRIEPEKGLEAAKASVAKVLGVPADSVKISSGTELLREAQEDVGNLSSPCFATVDPERMIFFRQWEIMKQERRNLQEQMMKFAKLKSEHLQKKKELQILEMSGSAEDVLRHVQRSLQEGTLSLRSEKTWVSQLGKLKALVALEKRICQADEELRYSERCFWPKLEECKRSLAMDLDALGIDSREQVEEFDQSVHSLRPFRPCGCDDCRRYRGELVDWDVACGSLDDAVETGICPRLLRRGAGIKPPGKWNKACGK